MSQKILFYKRDIVQLFKGQEISEWVGMWSCRIAQNTIEKN